VADAASASILSSEDSCDWLGVHGAVVHPAVFREDDVSMRPQFDRRDNVGGSDNCLAELPIDPVAMEAASEED